MTNSPSPEPESPQKPPLGFDEFVGILVAFGAIGTIFFWILGQKNQGFKLPSLLTSPQPAAFRETSPTPVPFASATTGQIFASTQPVPSPSVSPVPAVPVPIDSSNEVRRLANPTPLPEKPAPKVAPVIPFVVPVAPERATIPVPVAVQQPAAKLVEFLDVPKDFWARPFIQELHKRGIVKGFTGRYFRPNQPVTRAEFSALIQAAFNQKPTQKAQSFKDVPSDFWAVPAIEEATRTGFLEGYPGDIFRPKQQIPKAQVIVALASGLNLKPPSDSATTLKLYKDAAQIPSYAKNAVAAATQSGLVVNHPNPEVLNPTKNATRAEVAAFIYQALVEANKAKKINSKYIVQP